MVYESLMEKLLDENNDEIIELEPEGGEKVKFEQVGVAVYDGNPYAILRPLELKEDQVVVFKMDTEDEENIELLTDEELSRKVLETFNNELAHLEDDEDDEDEGE